MNNTSITIEIYRQIAHYVANLDWAYILTFITIAHGIQRDRVRKKIRSWTRTTAPTRLRVTLIGLIYGIALYFIRGYTIGGVETLLQSFVFALVFHKLIIQGLEKYITDRYIKKRPCTTVAIKDPKNEHERT